MREFPMAFRTAVDSDRVGSCEYDMYAQNKTGTNKFSFRDSWEFKHMS